MKRLAPALALWLVALPMHAQVRLTGDVTFGDDYGAAVAIDGSIAVVGAPLDATNGGDAGAAYVYERGPGGWTLLQKILGPLPISRFGFSVAVVVDESGLNEGDFIAVGSLTGTGATLRSGNVRMYRRLPPDTEFTFQSTLAAGDGLNGDDFGYAVALDLSVPSETLSGDPVYTLAVGARKKGLTGVGSEVGAVYVYQAAPDGSAWAGTAKLVPDDLMGADQFGTAVDISEDFIVAGAPQGTHPEGVAYLARRFFDTGAGNFSWSVNRRIKASDGVTGDRFGESVAISQGVVAVAARFHDLTASSFANEGAVYLVDGSTDINFEINETSKLLSPNFTAGTADEFGSQVAVDRHLMSITEKVDGGTSHIFQSDGQGEWSRLETLTTNDPDATDAGAESNAMGFSLPEVIVGDRRNLGPGGTVHILTNQLVFSASFEATQ